ncbi:MAG TPA: MFS transporter, partial [Solirubrobacteraceae bacterium]|nr:MFS transporter [Solirubrobacteraceae bacterium]
MSHVSPDLVHRRRWWTLAVLSLSLLVISLDNTILNVALPSIRADLGASGGELQWIVDAYMLVFAGLLLTAGSLGDRFGRRRMLTAGLAVFGAGSALAAVSADATQLIASRALMGVGGAAIMPSTLSILTAVFPARERGRAIAAWAAIAGLGIAVGPVAGGWLLEHGDWNLVFLVNVPVVAAALALGRVLVPESRDPAQSRLDPGGAALSIAGLTALLYGIIEAPARGWADGRILAAFVLAAALLAALAAWERRAPSPMLDLALFREPRFSAASAAIALLFFAMFGVLFLLTQYLQSVLGYDALQAGLRTMPVAGGLVLAGPASAKAGERLGAKLPVTAGMAIAAAGLAGLATIDPSDAYGQLAAVLAVLGFGIGLAMAPATDSIMGAVPAERASIGSAVNDTNRLLGGALGVAVLGSLVSSAYRGDMDAVTSGLPAGAGDAARDSVGGASEVAARLGGH